MVKITNLTIGAAVGLLFLTIGHLEETSDVLLVVFVGFSWFVAVWLILRNRRFLTDYSPFWSVLFVLVTVGAGSFGIHSKMPIADGLQAPIKMLILGVGSAGLGIGAEMAHPEHTSQDNNKTDATSD